MHSQLKGDGNDGGGCGKMHDKSSANQQQSTGKQTNEQTKKTEIHETKQNIKCIVEKSRKINNKNIKKVTEQNRAEPPKRGAHEIFAFYLLLSTFMAIESMNNKTYLHYYSHLHAYIRVFPGS